MGRYGASNSQHPATRYMIVLLFMTAHNSGSAVNGTIGVGIFDDIPGNPGDPDGPTPRTQGQAYTFAGDKSPK